MYVLIVLSLLSFGQIPIVAMQEFSSESSCREALKYIKDNAPLLKNVAAECMRK